MTKKTKKIILFALIFLGYLSYLVFWYYKDWLSYKGSVYHNLGNEAIFSTGALSFPPDQGDKGGLQKALLLYETSLQYREHSDTRWNYEIVKKWGEKKTKEIKGETGVEGDTKDKKGTSNNISGREGNTLYLKDW